MHAPRVQRVLAMGVVLIAYWMAMIDSSITNIGFGKLAGGLNVTIDEIAWVSSAYVLAMMIALPLAGWLSSALGRKRAFLLCLGLFTAASLACALSDTLGMLVVARFVQGFGAGGMQPLAMAALMDSYPEDQLGKAFKIIGIGGMVGPLTGPLIGGFVLDNFPWQMMFLVNLPVGLVALALAATVLGDQTVRAEKSRFDWTALALMATGLMAFQFVVQSGEREEWFSSTRILLAALLAVAALAVFVRSQLRSETPLVNLKPLRLPSYAGGTILAIVTGIGFTGTSFIVPLYFQQVLGFDATTAGLGMLPAAIATLAAIQFGGTKFAAKVHPVLLALVGLAVTAAGSVWLAMLGKNVGFAEIIMPRVLQGLGNGLTYLPLNILVMRGVPRAWYDGASGLSGLMRQFGSTMGYAVLSTFLVRQQTYASTALSNRVHLDTWGTSLGLVPIQNFLIAHGFGAGDAAGLAPSVFQLFVQREATAWAFYQTFFLIALLFAATLPVVALFWRTAATPKGTA